MKLHNIFKDSQIRLFVSGTVFAVAFVWMAISSYDVEAEVIRVFLILSFMLVGGLILCGFFFSFLIRLIRPKNRGLIDSLDKKRRPGERQSVDDDHQDKSGTRS